MDEMKSSRWTEVSKSSAQQLTDLDTGTGVFEVPLMLIPLFYLCFMSFTHYPLRIMNAAM